MATNKSGRETPGFIADTQSPEAMRRQFIDQPMEAARQTVFDSATELLGLMTLLPKAFAASQQREYERLLRTTNDEADPRLAYMKASLERAEDLGEMAAVGQSRIERVLVAAGGTGDVFHGFVQDGALRGIAGATVKISDARSGDASASLSARTEKDGYFSISLGRKASVKPRAGAQDAQTGGTSVAKVEILDASGKLVHSDPFPLALDGGSAYREYVIGDGEGPVGKTSDAGDDRKPPAPEPAPAPPTKKPSTRPAAPKAADKTKAASVARPAVKTTKKPKPRRK